MRPQSEVRTALAAALIDGPGTCRELAQRTGWSIAAVRLALWNMVRAGDAAVNDSVRRSGCKRPVPVYSRATRAEPVLRDAVPDLISVWAGIAAPGRRYGRAGAAM